MNIKAIFDVIFSGMISSVPFVIGGLVFLLLIIGGILLQKHYQQKEKDLAGWLYNKWKKGA